MGKFDLIPRALEALKVDQLFHKRPSRWFIFQSADALGIARELRRKIDDELF